MSRAFRIISWETAADILQEEIEIDWVNKQFTCPYCQSYIQKHKQANLPVEINSKGIIDPFCPFCFHFFKS